MTSISPDSTHLSPATRLGPVSLTVSDLARVRDFYAAALGLRTVLQPDGSTALTADGEPLVVLHGDAAAAPHDPRAPGLFHVAILLPSRRDLADALGRLAQLGWPLSGASDHLVSEALYLSDPEGNGIELYRDRARDEWPRDADGVLEMATLRLDLDDLFSAAGGVAPPALMPAGTTVGHVHLQVSDIPRAEAFYADLLGFAPTVRGYPGALFVSAGGYHHHIGLNTWNSAGAAPAAPGTAGLRQFELVVADPDERDRTARRLREGGAAVGDPAPDGSVLVSDPFGTALSLRAA